MSLLQNLCSIPGVAGAAVFTESGVCIEQRLAPPLTTEDLRTALTDVRGGLDACEFVDGSPSQLGLADFEGGQLAVLVAGPFAVITLGHQTLNPNQLWVAFGALRSKLERLNRAGALDGSLSASLDLPAILEPPHPGIEANDQVSPATLRRVVRALSESMGPIGRVIVQQELGRVGFPDGDLPRSMLKALLDRLALHIEGPQERSAFQGRIQADVNIDP
ncbi:MAG: hypothetical protein ACFB9M_11620 [Myxococcota bacterium]